MVAEAGNVLAGRYRLSRPLSKGGMSSVWLAHDLSLDVPVAIKLVRFAERAKDPGLADELSLRLVHEARVIAKISHPAIVRVIDVSESAEGEPFIVMELLEGDDLETVIRRDGALTAIDAVRHLLPILQGMIAVHEKGVIHRDLKPANVFLAKQDDGRIQPKLLDFGIAKSTRADQLGITRQGETMGSPAYMSPEQVRGEDTDERSDVWGACMTLYELVSGKLPFERGTHVASMLAILEGELEPLDCDIDLSLIVKRGLDHDPEKRWQSPTELGRELAAWLERQGVSHDSAGGAVAAWFDKSGASSGTDRPVSVNSVAPPATHSGSPRALVAVALASLFTIALTLGVVLARPSEPPLPAAQPLPMVEAPAAAPSNVSDELLPPPPAEKTPPSKPSPPPRPDPVVTAAPATATEPSAPKPSKKPAPPASPALTTSDPGTVTEPTEPTPTSTASTPAPAAPTPAAPTPAPTPTTEPSFEPE
jgi:serine/threonine-protein kinase